MSIMIRRIRLLAMWSYACIAIIVVDLLIRAIDYQNEPPSIREDLTYIWGGLRRAWR